MTVYYWGSRIAAAALAIGLVIPVHAQQPQTAPGTKAAPATQTPAAKTPPPKVEVKKTAKAAKAASPCQGLDQKACGAKSDCSWIAATKRKDGKEVKAYCRIKPKTVAKAPSTAAPAAATAPPAKK